MVKAKILVMGWSSLSYCAGILNNNTVYYTKLDHYKLKKWFNINKFI